MRPLRLAPVLCLVSTLARAQPAANEVGARALHDEGTAAHSAGKFLDAAARFEAAYALHPDPTYLFDLGQAYRSAERCAEAGAAFRKYLDVAPAAANASAVREYIQEMSGCVLFAEGRVLLGQGQPAAACAKFAAAHAEDPTALGMLTNLALCHERQGKLATARSWYRKALDLARAMHSPDIAGVVEKQHDVLTAAVAVLKIAAPEGSKVVVDGQPVLGSLDRVEVDPGDHVVEIGAVRREVTVRTAQHLELEFHRDSAATRDSRRIKQLGWIGGGLVLTSVALGFTARYRFQTSTDRDELRAWKAVVRYGGTTMFVTGAAAITGAVVLYMRRDTHKERMVISPVVTHEQVGLGVTGAF